MKTIKGVATKSKYVCAIVGVALFAAVGQSPAAATTYNYVGPAYDCFSCIGVSPDPNTGTNMTGSVTFNTNTSAFTGTYFSNDHVSSLVMTSGIFSLSVAQGELLAESFIFNNGQIVGWTICGFSTPGLCGPTALAGGGLRILQSIGNLSNPGQNDDEVIETRTVVINGNTIFFGANFEESVICDETKVGCEYGAWTAVPDPTPLPATLPLFATGLGALGLLGWRRKRKIVNTAS